jgi:hypothetical protein
VSWLAGVPLSSAALFVGYELLYVLAPGCLLYVLLSREPGDWPRILALGWPLGYALELGAYVLAAALHARGAFVFLPLVAAGVMGPLALRRYGLRRGTATTLTAGELLALCASLLAALAILATTYFALYPLPGAARSVVYYVDNVWDISIAAEARHHWPITEPSVAGNSPLHYYYGVFVHMAAVAQVTGVALSTIVLRLFPTSAIAVVALQLWALGRSLSRSRLVGPLAVVLLLVTEDLNLDPTRPGAFGAELFTDIPLSPTMAFGMIFFLGLLLLLQQQLSPGTGAAPACAHSGAGPAQGTAGWLALVGILILGESIAKASASLDFIAGLGLFWLWRLCRGQATRLLSYCLAVATLCAGALYLAVLRGGLGGTLSLHPFAFVKYTNFAPLLGGPFALRIVPLLAGVAVSSLFALAPLAGALWLLRRREAVSPFIGLCLAILLASLAIYVAVGAPSDSEVYFFDFGYLAGVPAAALGLALLWQDAPPRARRALLRACCAILALGLIAAASTLALKGADGAVWLAWYALAYGLLAIAGVLAALRLQRTFAPAGGSRGAPLLACGIPLLVVLGLVKPLSLALPNAWKLITATRISTRDSHRSQGMTAALYSGLSWVREHTSPCDVLAVNNHLIKAGAGPGYSSYYYYSAFAERRIFLESWGFTPEAALGGQPFAKRLALNTLATSDGDAQALRELRRRGVSYVLIDELHGGGAPEPPHVARRVFANGALVVYRILGPGPRGHRPCGSLS